MTLPPVISLAALLPLCGCSAGPFEGPPEGYAIVAEDDCGDPEAMPHVVRGKEYVFPDWLVSGARQDRDIVFDNDFCLLRYEGLNPQASYKVDVVYVTEPSGPRQQSLEANGLLVHDALPLPGGSPGRFIFEIPRAAYAGTKPLELKFIRRAGANAVVSYVRLWSTDPRPLPAGTPLWVPNGPIEQDWLRQDRLRGRPRFSDWEDPSRELRENVLPSIDEQLARGRSILSDLELLDAEGLAESAAELAGVERRRTELLAGGSFEPHAWLEVYRAARWAVRRLIFKHPLLPRDGLLFVRRHHPHAMHQCARRLGSFTLPGGGICLLRNISAEGQAQVSCVTDGHFPRGTFGRPDVSFDGQRLVFGYARERTSGRREMSYSGISERTAPLYAGHAVGPCHEFQVWEMGLSGDPPPRQLTSGPYENSDPLYLPDGRIAFMSHRPGGRVQCGDWALPYCLFIMNPDGSDVRQITMSKDGEWDPFLLEDGTIGFTRWEYVMKFWAPIQMLWSVRPDGTNPMIIYGSDLSKNYAYPLNYACARQIPGTSKLVCIGSAHHNTGAGPVCIVDMARGPKAADGLTRLTRVRFVETSDDQPHGGWYDCPYPLSEKYFLVSYSFSLDEADTTSYAIYLLDVYGGKELIYRDPELSALFPIPLHRRRVPPRLPTTAAERAEGFGELIIQDVHEGLAPEARGQARFVQIVECHERHIHTSPYDIQVGPDSGFETKTVLGTVPVEADGSAYFRLPAGKSVFFSVLDEHFQALHTMRSVTNVQPGERTSCVGCHENPRRAPANRALAATRRAPSGIHPPPWGLQPMDYAAIVQPVLDRHCIRCHDGSGAQGKACDLTAQHSQPFMGVPLPASYYTLRKYVRHAPIFQYHLPAGSFGSRVSPLMQMLAAGHHDVQLGTEDWRRLCAWIDCNAPGFGDYEVAAVGKAAVRMRQLIAARRAGSADRRQMLAQGLPAGVRLVCYLDCGVVASDAAESGEAIREVVGSPYAFGAAADVAPPWFDDISFDGVQVEYEVTGLQPDKRYTLGFSWWDYDNGGREQGVKVIMPEGLEEEVLPRTRLPAWVGRGEKPEVRTVALPERLTKSGTFRLAFSNQSGVANAVVSEVWLISP